MRKAVASPWVHRFTGDPRRGDTEHIANRDDPPGQIMAIERADEHGVVDVYWRTAIDHQRREAVLTWVAAGPPGTAMPAAFTAIIERGQR